MIPTSRRIFPANAGIHTPFSSPYDGIVRREDLGTPARVKHHPPAVLKALKRRPMSMREWFPQKFPQLMRPGHLLPSRPQEPDRFSWDTRYSAEQLRAHALKTAEQHIRAYPTEGPGRLHYRTLSQPCTLSLPSVDACTSAMIGSEEPDVLWARCLSTDTETTHQWLSLLAESGAFKEGSPQQNTYRHIAKHLFLVKNTLDTVPDWPQAPGARAYLQKVASWVDDGRMACSDRALDAFDRIYECTLLYGLQAQPPKKYARELLKLGIGWVTDQFLQNLIDPFFAHEGLEAGMYLRTHLAAHTGMPSQSTHMVFSRIAQKCCAYTLPRALEKVFDMWSTHLEEDGTLKDGVHGLAQQLLLWPPWMEFLQRTAALQEEDPVLAQQQWIGLCGTLEGFDRFCTHYNNALMGDPEAQKLLEEESLACTQKALFLHGYALCDAQAKASQERLFGDDLKEFLRNTRTQQRSCPSTAPALLTETDFEQIQEYCATTSAKTLQQQLAPTLVRDPSLLERSYSSHVRKGWMEHLLKHPSYTIEEKARLLCTVVEHGHNPWIMKGSNNSMGRLRMEQETHEPHRGSVLATLLKTPEVLALASSSDEHTSRGVAFFVSNVMHSMVQNTDPELQLPLIKLYTTLANTHPYKNHVSRIRPVDWINAFNETYDRATSFCLVNNWVDTPEKVHYALEAVLNEEEMTPEEKSVYWQELYAQLPPHKKPWFPSTCPQAFTADEADNPQLHETPYFVLRLMASLWTHDTPAVSVETMLAGFKQLRMFSDKKVYAYLWLGKIFHTSGSIPEIWYERIKTALESSNHDELEPVLRECLAASET